LRSEVLCLRLTSNLKLHTRNNGVQY